MDFTSVFLTPKIGHTNDYSVVQDCIVVMEWMENEKRNRINIDFLCDCQETNKNDYHFVLHVWIKMFQDFNLNTKFDVINIWTDGGPHHFKTRYCQWMWHFLSTYRFSGKPIIHNFFASYHGHSLADAHAASIKKLLRSQYNISQLQRFSPDTSALYWGPGNAKDFSALIDHSCSNSVIYVFDSIDRDPLLKPNCSAVNEIKKNHCYVYAIGKCAAAMLSDAPGSVPFSFTLKEHPQSLQNTIQ